MASRSAWTAKAAAWTTSLSSGCGAASNTRKSTSTLYASVAEAQTGIGAWLDFYNTERQHQSLGYRTPQQIYREGLWVCGRSAVPTGCASPASRASSESGEMLAFAHIPTGTTVNKTIDVDDSKSRGVAPATAPTLIGADIETGRATP